MTTRREFTDWIVDIGTDAVDQPTKRDAIRLARRFVTTGGVSRGGRDVTVDAAWVFPSGTGNVIYAAWRGPKGELLQTLDPRKARAVARATYRGVAPPRRANPLDWRRFSNPSDALTVANTILAQMGGAGRLKAMIGAHSFVGAPNSLTFKFKARARNGATALQVVLDPTDTYTMRFYAVRGIIVDELSDVYAEDLKRIFEDKTGLRLSF